MAGIPSAFIDELSARAEIVEVISGYIPLSRAGANFKACCPFHKEKSASFMVSASKQIFHCFGCGMGGNAFSFVMKFERVEFPEAVRTLAAKYGMRIPETNRDESQERASLVYKINDLASSFYHATLLRQDASHSAKRYLASRNVNDASVRTFKLGLALNAWDGLINYAKSKGFNPDLLMSCGLAVKSKDGGYYDMFRNRLIFPIVNVQGKAIGFGGRALSAEGAPKYLNSPETPVYNKGRHLYGFNLAKDSVREKDHIAVVEGYFDMLMPFQEGVGNVVATLGTALTPEHAKLIRRFTQNVVIVYDADKAGEDASLRSLEVLLEEELNVKIASLPPGCDPDDFVKLRGADAFVQLLNSSKGLFDYKLDSLERRFNVSVVEDKGKIAGEMLSTIYKLKNAVLRSGYIRRLAQRLSVSEESLISEAKRLRPAVRHDANLGALPIQNEKMRPAEKVVAALLLEGEPYAASIKHNLSVTHFKHAALRSIVESSYHFIDDNKEISVSALINYLDDPQIGNVIAELAAESEKLSNKDKALKDCINWLRRAEVEDRLNEIQGRIKNVQGASYPDEINVLITEFNELVRSLNN